MAKMKPKHSPSQRGTPNEGRESETIRIPRFTQFKPASEAASAAKRSNRNRDTKPELLLRAAVWKLGLRYRKNAVDLPGKPDLVFRRAQVAVFCDGDFWHGRDWDKLQAKLNGSANSAYWLPKIARNRQRDAEQTRALTEQGWHVIRFWESDVKQDAVGTAALPSRFPPAQSHRLMNLSRALCDVRV